MKDILIPIELFKENYKNLNNNSRVLYGFLQKIHENGDIGIDGEGNVFINKTRQYFSELTTLSKTSLQTAFNGLVEKKIISEKATVGEPNKIYILKFFNKE